MLILNEEKYAKSLYEGSNSDVKSVLLKIGYITRYCLYALNQSDEEIYRSTVDWMKEYHNNFDESYYANLISDAIKRAHKRPFYYIDSIKITQSELDQISSLNNLRAEKILFVLLCMSKHQSVSNGFTNGLVKYSITDLCKTARISVPSDDREYILYQIVQEGLLGYPKKNDTQCLIVKFINNDDDIGLELNEDDCKELAYAYLQWKDENNHKDDDKYNKKYKKCEYCKRLMKNFKKNPKRFCEECSKILGDVPDDMKVIKCVDCGQLFYVDIRNNNKERCNTCQEQYRKDYMKALMRDRRNQV